MADYFEIRRVVEELAKIYASQLAVSMFKVNNNFKPKIEEFRDMVVEFMSQFEYSIDKFPSTPEGIKFKELCRTLLENEVKIVREGNNKEVEKRFKYYTQYN